METYRQPIRLNDKHVTMLGMVSDLTGLVRRYYGNWQRPLAENREDLRNAKKLGDKIITLASQRPWREDALQNVLNALAIQDSQMHQRVIHILTESRAARDIAAYKALHNELRDAFDQEDTHAIWQTSKDLHLLSLRTLELLESSPLHAEAFYGRLAAEKKEDPVMHAKIVFTLNAVASLGPERPKPEIPKPRPPSGEIEIYRNNRVLTARMRQR